MTTARRTAAGLGGRLGGLALALGAGVVVSLAASAPASADSSADSPGGGTDSTAAEHSGLSARRAAAPGPRTDRTAATRPAAAVTAGTASRPDSSAAPKGEPSRRDARRSRFVPAGSAAVRASSPVRVPALNVTAPQPKSGRALFGWGDSRGRLITIYKGTHFAIPNNFGFFTTKVSGTGTFTPDTVYDLKDEDQYDWNKFTGIAFTPLEPDRNSVMVGWRYNLNSQEFEIAPFYNVDKKRILPNEQTEVISVPPDQTFGYVVDYNGVTVNYGDKTVFKPYPQGLTPNVWTAARVSGWFGGNEVAPRTVSYYLKLK